MVLEVAATGFRLASGVSRRGALVGVLGFIWFTQSAFVLLSGPLEARLPITPAAPTLGFVWDGSTPAIKNKDRFEGGAYADLADAAFFAVALSTAVGEWNSVYGSFARMSVTQNATTAKLDDSDNVYSIVVNHEASASTAASANPKMDGNSIVDCDIQMADREVDARTLVYTLVHEIGHCVGLGHNHSNYDAVMGYSRSQGNFHLGADDKAGMIYLYPDPNVVDGSAKEAVSCGSIGLFKSPIGSLLGLLSFLLFPLLPPTVIGRLRRRTGSRGNQ